MKKHINIVIFTLLILIIATIYLVFFAFTNKNKTIEIQTSQGIIESISIDYTVFGNPLSNVTVKNIEDTDAKINNIATKIDSPFDISGNFTNLQLQEANVSIKYNKEKLGKDVKEDDLLVLWYDEKNDQMVEMPTSVNSEKNEVTFKTNHFSQYVLVDKSTWQKIWNQEIAKIREKEAKFSLEFIIDDSGSMVENDRNNTRLSAVKAAIESLTENDEYLIMQFSDSSSVLQDFTNSTEELEEVLEKFKSSGGTNISGAVDKGIDLLKKQDKDREKIIILLTDGEDSSLSNKIDELTEKANKENIRIFGIGLQNSTDSKLNFDVFSKLATGTNGRFHKINETQLSNIFGELTDATVGVDGNLDTDGDGIPDGIELYGIRDQFGNRFVTNPYLADTDGDGKSDKEEIGEFKVDKNGNGYYSIVSNPVLNDETPEDLTNVYDLGPTNTGIEVHDSGFRSNVNGFSFGNFDYSGNGGYCVGMALITEKIYNGKMELNDGKYGTHLSEKYFQTLVKSKRLYDYQISVERLKLQRYKGDPVHTRETDGSDITNEYDKQLIEEIQEEFKVLNKLSDNAYRNLIGPTKVSQKMIDQLENIFDSGEIVCVALAKNDVSLIGQATSCNHMINAYAIEKMSETEYRLYVYDNNYPYNPYYIPDAYNGNLYITLRKRGSQYIFDYAPVKNDNEHRWNTLFWDCGIVFYHNQEMLKN